jgi:hypothetical protein
LLKFTDRTLKDVKINKTPDARQTTCVGMLPKKPRAVILHLIHVVMSYPIGILVEDTVT